MNLEVQFSSHKIRGLLNKYIKHLEEEIVDVDWLSDLGDVLRNENCDFVWQEIARFFFDNVIPFRDIKSASFTRMCIATARYEIDLKLLTWFNLVAKFY